MSKLKNSNVVKLIGFIATVILIVALIVLWACSQVQKSDAVKVNAQQDTKLTQYETTVGSVKSLAQIFTMYNQDTYNDAMSSIKMSSDIKKQYFSTNTYAGSIYRTAPVAQIVSVQYQYAPESAVKDFLMVLNVTREDGTTKTYNVLASYNGDCLVNLDIY